MRTALCLSGPVGFLYTKKSTYTWEQDIDYRIGHEHYSKHLFDVNDNVDVFIFSWSGKYKNGIDELYKPKKSKYEEQINFKPLMKQESTKNSWTQRKNHKVSRWYGFKEVIKLKSEYEKENNFKYDWVISSRFDEAFFKDLILEQYPNDGSIYFPWGKFRPERPSLLEYFYFSNSDVMDRYSTLYDNWEKYGLFNHHLESYHHAAQLKLPIVMLEDFKENHFTPHSPYTQNGGHQLVRAYYEDCEYKGDNYPGIDNLKKLNRWPGGGRFI